MNKTVLYSVSRIGSHTCDNILLHNHCEGESALASSWNVSFRLMNPESNQHLWAESGASFISSLVSGNPASFKLLL